jgi:hypothetical protein
MTTSFLVHSNSSIKLLVDTTQCDIMASSTLTLCVCSLPWKLSSYIQRGCQEQRLTSHFARMSVREIYDAVWTNMSYKISCQMINIQPPISINNGVCSLCNCTPFHLFVMMTEGLLGLRHLNTPTILEFPNERKLLQFFIFRALGCLKCIHVISNDVLGLLYNYHHLSHTEGNWILRKCKDTHTLYADYNMFWMLITVAMQSKVFCHWFLKHWDHGFQSHLGHGWVYVRIHCIKSRNTYLLE